MPFMQNAIGSKLMAKFQALGSATDDDNKFINFPAIPTKYNIYNIYSGALANGINGFPVLNGGLFPRLCNFIGESGCGKTSFAIGSMASAVDYVWNRFGPGYSELYYYDPENNTPADRFMNLANWSPADFINKCNYSNGDLTIVNLANQIMKIYDLKMKYKNDFLLPSGLLDVDGREVKFLSPTYICVDSVAAVNPNGVEELIEHDKSGEMKDLDKLGNNMEAAQDAKAWTIFVRKIKPFLDGANIGLYCVNHKTHDISTSMYDVPTRYLPFLAPGEKLKGGREFIYQSFNIINFASSDKLNEKNPVYGNDINGFITNASFVKNKFNIEGVKFPMVFDMNQGYMPQLSDMQYLWDKKFGIEGSVKLALSILPEIEFTRKTILDTIDEYPSFGRALSFTARFHATHDMLFRDMPMKLTDMGTNVPLEQRLAMLYQFTDSYNHKDDTGSAWSDFAKIAEANRHYVSFSVINPSILSATAVDNAAVNRFNDGYTFTCGSTVNPYNADDFASVDDYIIPVKKSDVVDSKSKKKVA